MIWTPAPLSIKLRKGSVCGSRETLRTASGRRAALALNVDSSVCRSIDKMLFKFVWKNKTHCIRDPVMINTVDSGGLNFLHFMTLNYTFKINWIKTSLCNPESIWNFIPHDIFSKCGVLPFLLRPTTILKNYHLKWPISINKCFSLGLLFISSFSPYKNLIWKNRDILFKNKSIFFSWIG